jgi:hypothetical protein
VNAAEPARSTTLDPRRLPSYRASTYVSMPDVPPARIVTYARRAPRRRLSPVQMGPTYADFFLEDTTRHATA